MLDNHHIHTPDSFPDDVQVKKAVKAFLKQEGDSFAEFMGVIPGLEDRMKTPPDLYGCERHFLMYFINDEMEDDFPLIARDFLAHEFSNTDGYEDTDFVNIDTSYKWPGRLFNDFVLNLMMNAADGGSEYAKALFLYLYKTYYKKEYKTLKKFSYLSREEVLSIAGPEEEMVSMMGTTARILTIARLSGIEISRDCDLLYGYFNKLADFQDEDFEKSRKFDESFGEKYKEAKEYIEANFDKDRLFKLDLKLSRFIGNVFEHLGYSSDIAESCDDNYHGIVEHLAGTLALLKKSYPSRDFTIEEITAYGAIYHIASAMTCNLDWLDEQLKTVTYGINGTDFYDHFGTKFDPNEISYGSKDEKPRTVIDRTKPKTSSEDVDTAELLKELASLRNKVRKLESDNSGLRSELIEKRSEAEEASELSEKFENANRELAALRNYVYGLTEEEKENAGKSLEEMKAFLSKKHVIIIGGHTNWVSKIKAIFPDWVYVNPDASGSTDASIVINADKVYFFTDIISHSKYYKYMNVVREKKADFGYIHGVNIEKNIRDIYKDLQGE